MEKTRGRGGARRGRKAVGVARVEKLRERATHIFLIVTLVLGGGGLTSPIATWLILMAALAVLAFRLPLLAWQTLDRTAKLGIWVFTAMAALCLLQIVPLPGGLWAGLPGHGVAGQIATAAGGAGWRAWSLSPDRTLDALTALIPAAAGMVIAAQATREQRRDILRLILIVALFSALLAIVQIGVGPGSAPDLFETRHRGFGVGLFVNRNHFALFLLLAILMAALPGIPGPFGQVDNPKAAEWGLRVGAFVLLTLGVLTTLSRAGVFLLPVALASAILLSRRRRVKLPLLFGGIGAAVLFGYALRWAEPVQAILARFATAAEDKRFQYWGNTLLALRDSLPLGTGFDTFTLIYPTVEPLDQVAPDIVNHAHSDVLELILEAGLPGAVLLVAVLAFIVVAVVRARALAESRRDRMLPLVVAIGTMLTFAASLVDYPLRMNTISVTLALLVGMLLPVGTGSRADAVVGPVRPRWSVAAPLLVVAVLATSSQWAQQLVRMQYPAVAAMIAPWFSPVQSAAANDYQMHVEVARSAQAARRALALSPLDARAVRAEGMALIAQGHDEQGAQLMSLGARLGWRDGITQLWLIEQALAAGADGFAIQRMDGLLRQQKFGETVLPLLPPLLRKEGGRAGLAEQLSYQPPWRVGFFNEMARNRTWSVPDLLDLSARVRMAKAPLTEADTMLIRAVLINEGRFGDVRRIWRETGQTAWLGNGDFEGAAGELPRWASPYAWFAPPLTGVRAEIAQAQVARSGQAVSISSDGLAQGGALAQTIVLAPGRYTFSFAATSQDRDVLSRLSANLACWSDGSGPHGAVIAVPLTWRQGIAGGMDSASGSFTVPADCPAQQITVSILETGGRPFSMWFDSVSIRSAALRHA